MNTTKAYSKKRSITFLQFVLVLIGIVTLAVLIRFPLTEGRAENLDLISIYSDPLILFGYLASIPFFVSLYQSFKLLKNIGRENVFSPESLKSLRIIKYCSLILGSSFIAGILYITFFSHGDDVTGPIGLGILATFGSIVVATAAAVIERTLQRAVELKSENDLTV